MSDNNSSVKFEYRNKNHETPFETFLRYTDEKVKSAEVLADIISGFPKARILDVGAGNGEYFDLIFSKLNGDSQSELTLLEPSPDLVKQLRKRFEGNQIVNTGIEDYDTDKRFDIIIAAHLFYHIPRATWNHQLSKMIKLLEPRGRLFVVLREVDDAYEFKNTFRPRLLGRDFKALSLDDVVSVLPDNVKVTRRVSKSSLNFPNQDKREDIISIIEFYLNGQWANIPEPLQTEIFEFIEGKDAVFKQRDGIAIIERAK